MNGFFSMDNKLFSFLEKLTDLAILNVLCILCCLPIVTIGPALTALFYVTLKMVKNEESYIVRSYFHSFKQNLKQGILIHLLMLAGAFLLFMDIRIAQNLEGFAAQIMLGFFFALALIYLVIFLYIYPVLAKFENTVRNTFLNALFMSVRHLPYTVIMAGVCLSPLLISRVPSLPAASFLMFLMAVLGGAAIAYVNSFFFVRIFERYIPKVTSEITPQK